jgi:hypothetical protein
MRELWRPGQRGSAARRAAVGAVVLVLAGAGLAAAAPSARSADRAGGVPWRLAGPGWSVVDYSAASLSGPAKSKLHFYLVSPQGRKYLFYVTPAATAFPELALLDWSGDRHRVLAYSDAGSSSTPTTVEQISLATGKVASRFKLPASLNADGYTRPRGHSMLAEGVDKPGIYRYDLTGHLQRVLARRTWLGILHVLDSPAGTFLVAGGDRGMLRISNVGVITGRTPVPHSSLCGPARWWTATTVLAGCFGRSPYGTERLWLVPARGGAPKPLTPALRAHGLFQGYFDAWTLGRQLYLQADNAHDTLSIVRQFADGTRRTITVPGPAGVSDDIIAAYHGRLLLQSSIGPGGASSLFWFNPVTRAEQFIFRAPPRTYGVAGVLPYGYWNNN